MSDVNLGVLERVQLRTIWVKEDLDFTPWLARQENLEILGKALRLELELGSRERPVGRFSADIFCKATGTDRNVVIENQLEKTDHGHLGQLLTYAAGLQAVTIIWIAESFTDEHRAALDWLNQVTEESVRFFGLEIELWRIGSSPPAPKFNIVAKPNEWSKAVAQAARAAEDGEPSETRQVQQKYWAGLNLVLNRKRGPVSGNRKPQPQSWMPYSIGRSNFALLATMVRPKGFVRAELYMTGTNAKAHYALLKLQRDAIENELGFGLDWDELPAGLYTRISSKLQNVNPDDELDWPRQHEWLADALNALHKVFAPRVRELDASSWRSEDPGAPH